MQRFFAKVDKQGPRKLHMRSRCWLWTASTFKGGYGKFWFKGKNHVASRVMWFLKTGRWPVGALHKCDETRCVRFSHLFEGGPLENNRDAHAKGRKRVYPGDLNPSRRYPEKVPRGEGHPFAKFSLKTVLEVRRLYATGKFKQVELARQFNISNSHLCGLLKRRFWRHV